MTTSAKNPMNSALSPRGVVAAILATAALSAGAAPLYKVTDLGMLPGCTVAIPLSLNERGDVVGYCVAATGGVAAGPTMGFVWHGGVMSAIGTLAGGANSIGTGINSGGTIVGQGGANHNVTPQGFVTTPSGLVNFFPTSGNVDPSYIGDNGFIGGMYTKGNNSPFISAIWTVDPKDPRKYRLANLTGLPNGASAPLYSQVAAFNQLGQAVGYAQDPTQPNTGASGVLWNNDAAHSIVRLGGLPQPLYLNGAPDCCNAAAFGMNDLGIVVGEKSRPLHGSDGVVWGNDPAHTATVVPPLDGDNSASVMAINNAGQMIGWSAYQTPWANPIEHTPFRMTLWSDGQAFELQSLLDPVTGAGVVLTTSTLTTAGQEFPIKINGAGQIIVTGTQNGTGPDRHALLLTPIAP